MKSLLVFELVSLLRFLPLTSFARTKVSRTLNQKCHRPFFPWQRLAKEESKDDDHMDDVNQLPFPSQPLSLPQAPKILTAAEESVRRAELDLLADLLQGDAAIQKLRDLWYGERGPEVEERLRVAWQGLGHPDYWPGTEKTLRAVIQQEGPTYLFPYVLLSKLYVFQQKFEESQAICERIYEIKPYHFSIIENMVANCVAQGKEAEAQRWQQKRLPTPDKEVERQTWVKQAIGDALRALEEIKQQSDILSPTETDDDGIIQEIRKDLMDGDDQVPDSWQ